MSNDVYLELEILYGFTVPLLFFNLVERFGLGSVLLCVYW